MKIKNKIYVIYDRKSESLVDSFIGENKEVALRFMSIRVHGAFEQKNFGLLTIWRDCDIIELYQIENDESISYLGNTICNLGKIIPSVDPESVKDEKNKV